MASWKGKKNTPPNPQRSPPWSSPDLFKDAFYSDQNDTDNKNKHPKNKKELPLAEQIESTPSFPAWGAEPGKRRLNLESEKKKRRTLKRLIMSH
jgi:hypothetical protein